MRTMCSRLEVEFQRDDDGEVFHIRQMNPGDSEVPCDYISIPVDSVELFLKLMRQEWEFGNGE